MKLTLESTERIITVNGVPARIWVGTSEGGVKCHAYITRVAVDEGQDYSVFERELEQCAPPSFEILAIPARLIL
jgi:hypothetical protein